MCACGRAWLWRSTLQLARLFGTPLYSHDQHAQDAKPVATRDTTICFRRRVAHQAAHPSGAAGRPLRYHRTESMSPSVKTVQPHLKLCMPFTLSDTTDSRDLAPTCASPPHSRSNFMLAAISLVLGLPPLLSPRFAPSINFTFRRATPCLACAPLPQSVAWSLVDQDISCFYPLAALLALPRLLSSITSSLAHFTIITQLPRHSFRGHSFERNDITI